MSYIRSPVSTVCVGAASSMASLLLAGGAAGKRYALPHSSVMVHQPLGGTRGQTSDILIYASQIGRVREQVNAIYLRHLNEARQRRGRDTYDMASISEMMERDKYMTADEAKEAGVIDDILHRREKPPEASPASKADDDHRKPTAEPAVQMR